MRRLLLLLTLTSLLFGLAASPPPFPWTLFAGGILAEPGILTGTKLGGCPAVPTEKEVVVWYITRGSGERWSLFAALEPPYRLIALKYNADMDPEYIYFGRWDGDTIIIERSEAFDPAQYRNACDDLFPTVPAKKTQFPDPAKGWVLLGREQRGCTQPFSPEIYRELWNRPGTRSEIAEAIVLGIIRDRQDIPIAILLFKDDMESGETGALISAHIKNPGEPPVQVGGMDDIKARWPGGPCDMYRDLARFSAS